MNREYRTDGWFNELAGMGTDTGTRFLREPIMQTETLANLYYGGDDLAATIVDALPKDALRREPLVVNKKQSPEHVKAVQDRMGALNWVERFLQAGIFSRLFGDAGVWVACEAPQELPKRPQETVRFLKHVDRRVMLVSRYYTGEDSEKLGSPSTYSIMPVGMAYSHENLGSAVHETRIARMVGWRLDPIQRAYNMGWNYSVLQRCINVIESMGTTWEGVSCLLGELSVKVLKLKNLQSTRATRPDLVLSRLQTIKQGISTFNLLALDKETEDFERVDAGALTGAAALLEMVLLRVASAAQMPVSKLFGRSPAGLNATGESDTRDWYSAVASYQNTELKPALEQAVSAVGSSMYPGSTGWEVEFPSLWQPTEGEEIDSATKVANLDQVLITNGVFTPEQIATIRGGEGAHWKPDYSSLDISVARALSRAPEGREPPETEEDPPETGEGTEGGSP